LIQFSGVQQQFKTPNLCFAVSALAARSYEGRLQARGIVRKLCNVDRLPNQLLTQSGQEAASENPRNFPGLSRWGSPSRLLHSEAILRSQNKQQRNTKAPAKAGAFVGINQTVTP
jgi:hypothetical protein